MFRLHLYFILSINQSLFIYYSSKKQSSFISHSIQKPKLNKKLTMLT